MMTLYGYWRSTAAYRVRIALNLKQIDYDSISIHLVKDGGEQHKPEYRAKNPQGLVPLLEHNEQQISQSMAICEYLDEVSDEVSLLPNEPFMRAQVRSVCQAIACDIHPINNLRVLQYLSGELGVSDEDRSAWYAHWIHVGFTAVEAMIKPYAEQGDYAFGKDVTLADAFIVAQLYNARRFEIDLTAYPRLVAVEQHCLELDAFKQAAPEAQADAT